jgi:hypothetical protein
MKNKEKFKLPKGFATKWVKALRSGKYVQTTGQLFRDAVSFNRPIGYCCLGVACKVAGVEDRYLSSKGTIPVKRNDDDIFNGVTPKLRNNSDLQARLWELNDQKEYGFRRIATWIEKNVEFV